MAAAVDPVTTRHGLRVSAAEGHAIKELADPWCAGQRVVMSAAKSLPVPGAGGRDVHDSWVVGLQGALMPMPRDDSTTAASTSVSPVTVLRMIGTSPYRVSATITGLAPRPSSGIYALLGSMASWLPLEVA